MNIVSLRNILKSRWAWLWHSWSHRDVISGLCDMFDALPQQEKELREQISELRAYLSESDRLKGLAEREAESVSKAMLELQADLRNANEKYQQLLIRKEAPEERAARDALYLAKLEIEDLKVRLENERQQTVKARGQSQKMWNFIALRHRIDLPATNGTIRKVLQQTERKR